MFLNIPSANSWQAPVASCFEWRFCKECENCPICFRRLSNRVAIYDETWGDRLPGNASLPHGIEASFSTFLWNRAEAGEEEMSFVYAFIGSFKLRYVSVLSKSKNVEESSWIWTSKQRDWPPFHSILPNLALFAPITKQMGGLTCEESAVTQKRIYLKLEWHACDTYYYSIVMSNSAFTTTLLHPARTAMILVTDRILQSSSFDQSD